jgi:hypothetical protein
VDFAESALVVIARGSVAQKVRGRGSDFAAECFELLGLASVSSGLLAPEVSGAYRQNLPVVIMRHCIPTLAIPRMSSGRRGLHTKFRLRRSEVVRDQP